METLTNLANQGKIAKLKPFKVKPPSKISAFKRCNSTTLQAIRQHFFRQNSMNQDSSKFNNAKVSSFTVPLTLRKRNSNTMEELKRFRLSHRGFRAHLATLTTSLTELTERCKEHPPGEEDIVTLTSLLEQLNRKKEILNGLHEKIAGLTDLKDLEAEIVESEETQSSISRQITQVKRLLSAPTPTSTPNTDPTSTQNKSKEGVIPRDTATQENVIGLPYLNMPTFSGDPLSWEPFWDSFQAAVHSNSSLSAVQKLTYLRSQLHGSAAKVISGLTLTSPSYEHSITLLKDRFGQPHKLVHAHMQALLDLPSPIDTLSSLETFYDAIEGHVRSLSSLGKPVESYGNLLVTVILSKLPAKARKNLVSEHNSGEWTLDALLKAIKQEVRILELETQTSHLHATASLHTGTTNNNGRPHQPEPHKKHPCVFCKGSHTPH